MTTSDLRDYQALESDGESALEGPPPMVSLYEARRISVQGGYERFAPLFARCDAAGGLRPSFSLGAFLFGGLWFCYRKMYREALMLTGLNIALVVSDSVFFPDAADELFSPVTLAQLAVAILIGIYGKACYWAAVNRRLEKAMDKYPAAPGPAVAWLGETGGVDFLAAAGLLLAAIMVCGLILAFV